MRDGLEFNPLASRLRHLWEGVRAMGGDLTRAGEKFDQAHLLEGWGISLFQQREWNHFLGVATQGRSSLP